MTIDNSIHIIFPVSSPERILGKDYPRKRVNMEVIKSKSVTSAHNPSNQDQQNHKSSPSEPSIKPSREKPSSAVKSTNTDRYVAKNQQTLKGMLQNASHLTKHRLILCLLN